MDESLVQNASSEKQVKAAGKKEKTEDIQKIKDLKDVLEIRSGRNFIWKILINCHIFSTTFNPDTQQMAFNEGQRNVGLRLLADINKHSPKAYLKMLEENNTTGD